MVACVEPASLSYLNPIHVANGFDTYLIDPVLDCPPCGDAFAEWWSSIHFFELIKWLFSSTRWESDMANNHAINPEATHIAREAEAGRPQALEHVHKELDAYMGKHTGAEYSKLLNDIKQQNEADISANSHLPKLHFSDDAKGRLSSEVSAIYSDGTVMTSKGSDNGDGKSADGTGSINKNQTKPIEGLPNTSSGGTTPSTTSDRGSDGGDTPPPGTQPGVPGAGGDSQPAPKEPPPATAPHGGGTQPAPVISQPSV